MGIKVEYPNAEPKKQNNIIAMIVLGVLTMLMVTVYFGYWHLTTGGPTQDPRVLKVLSGIVGVFFFALFLLAFFFHGKYPIDYVRRFLSIKELISEFESGKLPKDDWHHMEHLRVALYYVFHEQDIYSALTKMRCGLIRHGVLRDVPSVCKDAYHETITFFWMFQLEYFIKRNKEKSFEQLEELLDFSEFAKKDYIYKFYDQETLSSTEARATYIPTVILQRM